MKTIYNYMLQDLLKAVIIALTFALCISFCSCSATRQDWKPAKVKMEKVMYNGHQVTRGYTGY